MPEEIEKYKEKILLDIEEDIKNGVAIIPFVGAGLSVDYGYPTWKTLLQGACQIVLKDDPYDRGIFNIYIQNNNYRLATNLLCKDKKRKDAFEKYLTKEFDGIGYSRDRLTPMSILPKIIKKYVVTTNLDRCLEKVLENAGMTPQVYYRSLLKDINQEVLESQNTLLIKLHGTAGLGGIRDRILTKEDYEEAYLSDGKIDLNKHLPAILNHLTISGKFLFIGCSLMKDDYILEILRKFQNGFVPGVHYAILEKDKELQEARDKELQEAGIRSIWFDEGKYKDIWKHLQQISQVIERINNIDALSKTRVFYKKSIVRISSNINDYEKYAAYMTDYNQPMDVVIWTMNGSPLNIFSDKNDDYLTSQDRKFERTNARKFRIIIFKDLDTIKYYTNARGDESKRKNAFENSCSREPSELLFGSRKSLKNYGIAPYFDFGYVSTVNKHSWIFCSAFESSDFKLTQEKKNNQADYKDIITFSENVAQPRAPKNWNIEQQLKGITRLISCIHLYIKQKESIDGLYSDIDNLIEAENK